MTLLVALLAAWAILLAAPNTPIGRWLHRVMVATPAAWIDRIRRGHVALVVLLLVTGGMVVWLLEGDGVKLLSMASPEIVTWLTLVDITAYLDAALALIVAASSVRMGGLVRHVSRWLSRGPRDRHARTRRPHRRQRPPANDDEDGAGVGAGDRWRTIASTDDHRLGLTGT